MKVKEIQEQENVNLQLKSKKKVQKLKEKGITLIALVVTIIILLILVGVTISQLSGENGLIKKAKDAVEKYKNASEEEQNQLGQLGQYVNVELNSDIHEKLVIPSFVLRSSQWDGTEYQWIDSYLQIKNNSYSKITITSVRHSGNFTNYNNASTVTVNENGKSSDILSFYTKTNYDNLTADLSMYSDEAIFTIKIGAQICPSGTVTIGNIIFE